MRDYKLDTKCIHAGYTAQSGQPQVLPIVQNTTYRYYDSADVAKLFDLESADYMYSRLGSPTVNALEEKMAALEGGTAGIATSSGQAANLITMLNICESGDHIIASASIYGGTHNLFGVTLKKMGIETTFIDQNISQEEIVAMARPETKALFAESLGNPALTVLDFDKFSKAAKEMGVPLVVDNTLATPVLCRPLELGADIVTHSTTKYSDGHATSVGGMVIEGGKFDWAASGKFPGMTEPDESYHGLKYYEKFGSMAFCVKLRAQMLRDLGCTMAPMNGFLTFQGLDTLHLRMERHSQNALALAKFLQGHEMVDWVSYPGLEGDAYYALAQKYLPKGASGVLSFGVKGGKAAGEDFLKKLQLTSIVVHVGDIRTSVLHPASTTHRQLSEAQQLQSGIKPELIRVSVGIEDIDDILADFDQALNQLK
ncbi:MAG: O-acetylhomoserine aminocarboxypropyltransferase/cysteine synthase family protein [Anaerovoracaceae bacterium]